MSTAAQVRVVRGGLAWVQDGGRPGRMAQGVPPGGPLAPTLLARANVAVGNSPDAPAIELLSAIEVAWEGDAASIAEGLAATDDGAPFALREPQNVAPRPGWRVGYLAVAGGFDVPVVLGGRGTLLVAGIGGHHGRSLRAGDRLPVGRQERAPGVDVAPAVPLPPLPDLAAPVPLRWGPDVHRFDARAREQLLTAAYRTTASFDRTGLRLAGPAVPRLDGDGGRSAPMVAGAVQVTAAGEVIVLGPDHPTTGGYPVVAVLPRVGAERLFARPAGALVRFCENGGGDV